MENSTSGPVLYCAFVACICAYWPLFLAVDWTVWRFFPDFHHRLEREDKTKKLVPFIMMIVRVLLGVGISLPSCAYAGYMTPPGINQPLSVAGQVCIASQTTVWATELRIIMMYSNELLVHHTMCLLVTANAVLSPSIHQVKPLYIYFASQLGDLGPAAIILTKLTGRRPHTSRLMYYATLGATCWTIVGKCGATGTSLGLALQNPYRIGDWVWAICLSFFCIYSLYSSYRNLKWIGIVKPDDERHYSAIFLNKVRVHAAHLWLGVSFSTTLVSTLFVYSLYKPQAVNRDEIGTLAIEGLVAASVGLTSAVILQFACQAMSRQSTLRGQDLYLQYGLICAAAWITWAANVSTIVDEPTILAALGFNIPLFEAVARVGQYYAIKEQYKQANRKSTSANDHYRQELVPTSTLSSKSGSGEPVANEKKLLARSCSAQVSIQRPLAHEAIDEGKATGIQNGFAKSLDDHCSELSTDEEMLEKPASMPSSQASLAPCLAKKHLGMCFSQLAMYWILVVCLGADLFSLSSAATLAVAITALNQLLQSILSGPEASVIVPDRLSAGAAILRGCMTMYALFKMHLKASSFSEATLQLIVLLGNVGIGRLMVFLLRSSKKPQKRDGQQAGKKGHSSKVFNTWTATFVITILLQIINIREVLRDPIYTATEDLPLGWTNFRTALTSPVTWVGAIYMVILPVVALGGLQV